MNGTMTLSDGPGSLRAGSFRATPGTTLGPGQAGTVPIPLDQPIPAGPWNAHVTLGSGLLKHTADANITFPAKGVGRSARPITHTVAALMAAGGGLLGLVVAVVLGRRLRRTRTAYGIAPARGSLGGGHRHARAGRPR